MVFLVLVTRCFLVDDLVLCLVVVGKSADFATVFLGDVFLVVATLVRRETSPSIDLFLSIVYNYSI